MRSASFFGSGLMNETSRGTVIFDLDGTLVDSAPDLADALDALLRQRGLEPVGLEMGRSFIGHGIPRLVQQGLAARGISAEKEDLSKATDQFLEIYSKNHSRKTRPYPGAVEALDVLQKHGWRLAVSTNKLEESARAILTDLNLISSFSCVVGPDTFGVAKPDPRPILGCLPEGQAKRRPAILVGDSAVDIGAAQAAEIPVILVSWGYGDADAIGAHADAVVDMFETVPEAVERLVAESP